LSAFDTVKLKPIADPIAPAETFEWQQALIFSFGLIVGVAVFAMVLWKISKFLRHKALLQKPLELKSMRTELRRLEKGDCGPETLNVDVYWNLVQGYLVSSGRVKTQSPSLEDLQREIVSNATLEPSIRNPLLLLIPLVEQYKYVGKPETADRSQIGMLFVKLFQNILASEGNF